jgi:hypothetical protein
MFWLDDGWEVGQVHETPLVSVEVLTVVLEVDGWPGLTEVEFFLWVTVIVLCCVSVEWMVVVVVISVIQGSIHVGLGSAVVGISEIDTVDNMGLVEASSVDVGLVVVGISEMSTVDDTGLGRP